MHSFSQLHHGFDGATAFSVLPPHKQSAWPQHRFLNLIGIEKHVTHIIANQLWFYHGVRAYGLRRTA